MPVSCLYNENFWLNFKKISSLDSAQYKLSNDMWFDAFLRISIFCKICLISAGNFKKNWISEKHIKSHIIWKLILCWVQQWYFFKIEPKFFNIQATNWHKYNLHGQMYIISCKKDLSQVQWRRRYHQKAHKTRFKMSGKNLQGNENCQRYEAKLVQFHKEPFKMWCIFCRHIGIIEGPPRISKNFLCWYLCTNATLSQKISCSSLSVYEI